MNHPENGPLQPDHEASEIEKFETLFQEIPAALALLKGPTFVFEAANEEFYQLVGRTDLLGKTLLEAIPELEGQPFPAILDQVFSTGETFRAREVQALLRPLQSERGGLRRIYVDITYRRISDRNGKPYGIFAFAVNVTEKVEFQAKLRLERLKLETVFTKASAAMAILQGNEFVYEKANANYLSLFQDRPIVGHALLTALPELKGQKFPDLISQVHETGLPYSESEACAWLRRTESSPLEERFFDQSYTQILDSDGKPYGVLIQANDVTERVNSRVKLAESLEQYRFAIEAARMGAWDLNVLTGQVDGSPRTNELFGLSSASPIPLNLALNQVHLEDRPRVEAALTQAMNPEGNGVCDIEYRIIQPGRDVRWLALRGKCAFAEGPTGKQAIRLSGTVLDVTDRALSEQALRRSERQFRLMADTLPQVVWTARPDGMLDYTNARWSQYSGSSDPGKWLNFVHREDTKRAVEDWTRSVATGENYETEFRLLRESDSTYRWFLVRAQAFRGQEGRIERWFGTCTDIEDQKAALAARSEFMSIASHELKTPLTSLKLQTQSMRRSFERGKKEAFSPENVGKMVTNNEKQVGRLIRLVDDMLDFSKIESGKLSMTREWADVSEIVRDVYEQLEEQLSVNGCPSRLICGPPATAWVDRFRIEQVVTNFLTNASRYGNGSPVVVKVEPIGDKVVVSVSDQGRGIAPESLERVFNRFERAVSANEISGLGLGLYISREIIVSHQGRIWVQSELGVGSTFFFELPVRDWHEFKTS